MNQTKKRFGRWLLALSLACGSVAVPAIGPRIFAQQPAAEQVASSTELKQQAFQALKQGDFGRTNDLLNRAASVSKDPALVRMAEWTKQFEEQRQVFVAEREKEYQKAVEQVRMLMEKDKDIYAMEVAARAYMLAPDKDKFRTEPFAAELLGDAKKLADQYERNEQWLKALRLYSQLSAIEPESAEWKDHMKVATRRVRLLALYAPDELKKIQSADTKEREEVEALLKALHPDDTKKDATAEKAAADKKKKTEDDEEKDQNRIDWRETLRDVRVEMLEDALINTRSNYYRDVNFKKMLKGGLQGMRVVLTTPALEKPFPGVADAAKRGEFLGWIDGQLARVDAMREDEREVTRMLAGLQDQNDKTVRLPREVLVSEFADGAFGVLDPFSNIIWPSDWEEFQKTTKGEFSGVGIQIQSDDSGYIKVVSPLEDSPAYRAGIKPDWLLTHIDGKSARWVTLNQAVKRITGEAGTKVRLTIKDDKGDSKEYSLTRETIKVASVKGWLHRPGGGWDYYVDPEQRIGYIRMTNFTKTTADDLDRALADLQKSKARGVILDLRYNPGGLLNAATDVVDKFIGSGVIVSTKPDRLDSPNRPTSMDAKRKGDEVSTPLIVLVNQYSASASEIVSGALKDHSRAMVVGERTFGKGSVQMLYPLGDRLRPDAVLKLTTSHYYLPSNKCIHREENSKEWGVDPDITIEMTPEQMRAAMDARQDFDILRDAIPSPAERSQLPERAENAEQAVNAANQVSKKKDPLSVDAQLSAALLLMRLQLAGDQI